jgi:Restriction endonuclease
MTENKWTYFERLVAAVHQAADAGANVKWNDTINGRQFDVTIRFRKGLYDHLTVVECKNYEKPVPVEKVEAFVTKSRDVQANVAVLASTSGFQSGAKDAALRHNIALLHVTPSGEVDPAIFGAKWGDSIDVMQIEEIALEFVNGEKTSVPSRGNVLTYYAHHTTLERAGFMVTLNSLIDGWLQPKGWNVPNGEHVIPVMERTVVTGPQDGVIPLKQLAAIRIQTLITKARTLHGPNMVDPSFLLPNVIVQNVHTGEVRTFKYRDLALGIDNAFLPGKFYEAPELGYCYFCERVKDGIAEMCMVESFQHGQLIQARFTMDAKYAKMYIPVTDKTTIERLQRRLDRLKENGSGV